MSDALLARVAAVVDRTENKVDDVSVRLARLEERIDGLDRAATRTDAQVETVAARVAALEQRRAEQEQERRTLGWVAGGLSLPGLAALTWRIVDWLTGHGH